MFENWEVAPFKKKMSPRAATWSALLWAFLAGVVTGLLWAGRLPLNPLNIVSLAILVGGAILLVVRFTWRPNCSVPPSATH
jgi:hypothetical protein